MMESAPADPDVSARQPLTPTLHSEAEEPSGSPVADQPLEVDGQPPDQVGRRWQAILFAPVGDGTTRRRGSDAVRLGLSVLVVLVCWLAAMADSNTEHSVASALSPPPGRAMRN